MARKVLYGFLDKLDRVILDWAFTIEAYDDEEQPEVILGAVRLFKIQPRRFPSWEATLKTIEDAKEGRESAKKESKEPPKKDGKDKLPVPTPANANSTSSNGMTTLSKSPSAIAAPPSMPMSPERKAKA